MGTSAWAGCCAGLNSDMHLLGCEVLAATLARSGLARPDILGRLARLVATPKALRLGGGRVSRSTTLSLRPG
eukprot:13628777-Alexandrium_andersonii.AAC.1